MGLLDCVMKFYVCTAKQNSVKILLLFLNSRQNSVGWRVYGFTWLCDEVLILQYQIEFCQNSAGIFVFSAELRCMCGYTTYAGKITDSCWEFKKSSRILTEIYFTLHTSNFTTQRSKPISPPTDQNSAENLKKQQSFDRTLFLLVEFKHRVLYQA